MRVTFQAAGALALVAAVAAAAATALIGSSRAEAQRPSTAAQAAGAAEANAVALEQPAFEPVQARTSVRLRNERSLSGIRIFRVPAGKRLIVDFVSVSCTASARSNVVASVSTDLMFVPLPLSRPNSRTVNFTAAQVVRLFARPGESVTVGFRNDDTSLRFRIATFMLVGRLVDA